MQGKHNYRKQSAPQYPDDEKGAYYRSADQNSDHPLSRIDFCIDFIESTLDFKQQFPVINSFLNKKKVALKEIPARRDIYIMLNFAPYKKHLCQLYEQQKKCPKSKFLCLFAHGENDIWNSKFPETKATSINSSQVDERKKNQKKSEPIKQKPVIQALTNLQAQQLANKQEDIIQQIIKMKKDAIQNGKPQQENGKKKKENGLFKKEVKEKNTGEQYAPKEISSRRNNREKRNVQSQQQVLRVHNNQRNQEVSKSTIDKRNGQRSNQQQGVNPDALTDEQFDEYLLQLKEKQLMNEQGDEQDDFSDYDDDDQEEQEENSDRRSDEVDSSDPDVFEKEEQKDDYQSSSNSSEDKDNDLFIDNKKNSKQSKNKSLSPKEKSAKPNKNTNQKKKQEDKELDEDDDESWESEQNEDDEEEEPKNQSKAAKKSKNGTDSSKQQQNLLDFKSIDWKNLDEDKLTNQQLMTLYATILQNENEINSDEDESDENNLSKEYNQMDEQKLQEERQKRKQERAEQRKKKKEEKKQQKQIEKDRKTLKHQAVKENNAVQQNGNVAAPNSNVSQSKDQLFSFDQLEIYCFCYFNSEADLKNWKATLLDVFYELQIPRNALIITEEDRCEGEYGVLIKLKSLRVVCLQLLRINLYKTQKLKILFKIIANPDSQILFSKQVIAAKKLNDHSFQGQDGQNYIIFNSTIDHSESENLEFKNYDFRNYNENTRKLEEVITGMLNREEFESESFYNKEQISGRIFLGVKDATRQFVGSHTTNNHHESFFTFLAKRLRDCQPAVKANLYQREECRLVIPGESENEFYPILDLKIFIITVNKPEKNTIYATSSGLYFQKIEEGNWPMSACSLYEKKQKNYISEEKFKLALKQLDRRYFYVMAKMANQNALIQSDFSSIEQSQF